MIAVRERCEIDKRPVGLRPEHGKPPANDDVESVAVIALLNHVAASSVMLRAEIPYQFGEELLVESEILAIDGLCNNARHSIGCYAAAIIVRYVECVVEWLSDEVSAIEVVVLVFQATASNQSPARMDDQERPGIVQQR